MKITTELTVHGRQIHPGTELSITKERGRYRFMKHVENNGVEWIDVWGGPKGREQTRGFRPDRIKTVHYKNKTDKNLLAERRTK